jgi:glycosyltransferase involved in cell wall biosynthesis
MQKVGKKCARRMQNSPNTTIPQTIAMGKISVYVIAFNEAEKVAATLASVQWADEIVVVDSHSTDQTAQIALGLGARVVQVDFKGFGDLRNQAISACTHEWIFSLDADERCTPQAQAEIQAIVRADTAASAAHDAYWMPRRNFFMGRWIKHSGWYPNYRQPQLFRKGSMHYDQKEVHENYVLTSSKPIGVLTQPIWQFPFKNMSEVMHKANRYSTLGAERLAGRKLSMGGALVHGLWSFVKHYLFKRGFLDGWPGFVIALGNFEGTFYRYVKAIEKQKAAAWQPPASLDLTRPET